MRSIIRSFVAFFVVILGSAVSFSQTSPVKVFKDQKVKISNFGQMDARFYRGGQPKQDQYAQLKEFGINTVIDLQDEPTSYEKAAVEALGMRYVNIPVIDKAPPTAAQIADFLKVVDDPQTGVFYVHCAGGRHRTGDMGAIYRLNKNGWNYDQAYQEMKNYDFYTSWGHGSQKDFVVDYFTQNEKQRAEIALNLAATTAAGSK